MAPQAVEICASDERRSLLFHEMTPTTCGRGGAHESLTTSDLRAIVTVALADVPPGSRVLAIVPDRTRDDNTHLLVPLAAEVLRERAVDGFDVLVAQGTHPPMTDAEVRRKIGRDVAGIAGLGQSFRTDGMTLEAWSPRTLAAGEISSGLGA